MEEQKIIQEQLINELAEMRRQVAELKPIIEEIKKQSVEYDSNCRKLAEMSLENERYKLLLIKENLQASHRQLQGVIEFLPDATFVINNEKEVIAWNRAIEDMTGVRKEDILGLGDYAYSIPFYGKPRPILIDLIFNENEEISTTYGNLEKKGNTICGESFTPALFEGRGAYLWGTASRLYDNDGNMTGAIESIRDISDRQQAEEALRLSEERFYTAFNASPALMAINSLSDGKYIDVNSNFLRSTGYNRKEVIGSEVKGLKIWPDKDQYMCIKKMIIKSKNVHNKEISYLTKTGDVCTGLFSAEIINISGKRCILSTVNDITERRKLEKEMARLDRLHLVGEMAAGIGHEIRNPMTTVRGFLQLLGSKGEYTNHREYFDVMIEELDRANLIIKEFLSLAKNKMVDLKEENLNSIIKSLFPLINADAIVLDKYVKLELEEVKDLLLDEKEICQLILNLVRNGLEAMSAGGYLTIKTFQENEDVVLVVQDEGTGIAPEALEKIGNPFFTTKENGTGPGLAICYSIADRHNARIEVDTGPSGTTFYTRFA